MFDYVIAGAGSAGCVLAARLSEDPATRGLLLEAGAADDAPEIQMPAGTPMLAGPYRLGGCDHPAARGLAAAACSGPRGRTPLSRAWVEAAVAAGLAANPDFNGPPRTAPATTRSPSGRGGAGRSPTPTCRRCPAATSRWRPAPWPPGC